MAINYTNNKFGDVTVDGKLISLTENAYADNYGTDGGVRYYAKGSDSDGNEYLVAWDTSKAWDALQEALRNGEEPTRDAPDPNDESVACDWDSPVSARAV